MENVVYSQDELYRIQELELGALAVIDKICNEQSIEYFLIGGSALGALRHNGFIPWDDDIDIGMTRKNYQMFLKEAPTMLPEGYFLQTPYENTRNPYFYTKLRIDGTKFVEYCNHRLDIHHGVYVDVFPFDEVPDNEKLNIKQFNSVQRMMKLFSLRQSPDIGTQPHTILQKSRSTIRKGLRKFAQLLPYHVVADAIEKQITQYNGTGQHAVACLNFPIRKTEYIMLSDLYPLQYHTFENMICPIPGNIDFYLRTHYGNYMQLPLEDQRFGHKPYYVDLG